MYVEPWLDQWRVVDPEGRLGARPFFATKAEAEAFRDGFLDGNERGHRDEAIAVLREMLDELLGATV